MTAPSLHHRGHNPWCRIRAGSTPPTTAPSMSPPIHEAATKCKVIIPLSQAGTAEGQRRRGLACSAPTGAGRGGPKEMHLFSHPKATAAAFVALERHRDAARQEVSSSSPRVEDEKALNWRRNAKNKESNPRMKPGRALGPAGLLLADPTQGTFRDRARTEPTPERPRNGPAQPRPGKAKASRCRRTTNSKGLVLFCFVSQPPPLF